MKPPGSWSKTIELLKAEIFSHFSFTAGLVLILSDELGLMCPFRRWCCNVKADCCAPISCVYWSISLSFLPQRDHMMKHIHETVYRLLYWWATNVDLFLLRNSVSAFSWDSTLAVSQSHPWRSANWSGAPSPGIFRVRITAETFTRISYDICILCHDQFGAFRWWHRNTYLSSLERLWWSTQTHNQSATECNICSATCRHIVNCVIVSIWPWTCFPHTQILKMSNEYWFGGLSGWYTL